MIEQLSNPIQFLAHFVASGVGATGLTVTVDVRKWDGTTVITIATDAAATEIGGGLYGYSLGSGSTSAEAIYTAVFKTAGTADQKHLPALWCVGKAGVEKLDATVSSGAASASTAASQATLARKLLEADLYVKTSTTPWQLVYVEKGTGDPSTGTVLLTQNLKTVAGANVTAITTHIGQQVAP